MFSEEEIVDSLLEMGISHLYRFIGLFKKALRKYIVWQKVNVSLDDFIKKSSEKSFINARELAWAYYWGNGGYESGSHFLFGTASQFRQNSS